MATNPTRREANRICNVVPSRNIDKDWRFEHALESGAVAAPAALPASVDLRATWWNIGDQQQTGSCVGWGSTDGVARYHFVKAGRLAQNASCRRAAPGWRRRKPTSTPPSRRRSSRSRHLFESGRGYFAQVRFCARAASALPHRNIHVHRGREHVFRHHGDTARLSLFQPPEELGELARLARRPRSHPGRSQCRRDLGQRHCDHGLLDNFQPDTVRGGHAPCVVGYRADGRFIVRNSWGTGWGDHGFAYASEAYIQAAFFNESYGVTL